MLVVGSVSVCLVAVMAHLHNGFRIIIEKTHCTGQMKKSAVIISCVLNKPAILLSAPAILLNKPVRMPNIILLSELGSLIVVRLLVFIVLSIGALNIRAEPNVDAYRVEVMVPNQSESERNLAAKATFGNVIAGVAGDANVLLHPLVHEAIGNAPNYVARFNYVSEREKKALANAQNNRLDTNKPQESNKPQQTLKLVLSYSPVAIQNLLREARLSVSSGQQDLVLQVVNVRDLASFKQVQAYFKTINLISSSELVNVNKDVMLFNITMEKELAPLKDLLMQNPQWALDETLNMNTSAPQLSFRWKN
jgi:hypothetical protein